ncbi:MAG: FHA domain-containing protein [Planctomycetaceae bacterium]|nr:FHA domain-containing protein [Planctomycetaceae bacterium]
MATCPSCYADLSGIGAASAPPAASVQRGGTVVESVQGIRDQIQQAQQPAAAGPARSGGDGRVTQPEMADDTVPFRPLRRMPTLKLCVLDDGSRDQGEWFWIRKPRFLVGRVEGDLIIGNEIDMSGKHFEIVATMVKNEFKFVLRDVGSRNGTFLRVSRLVLRKDMELILGARRYRFDPGSASQPEIPVNPSQSTGGWERVDPTAIQTMFPALVEQTGSGAGKRHDFRTDELFLGRDARRCVLHVDGDPLVSPVHAKISRDQKGRWQIENQSSLNGIWLRVQEVALDGDAEVQAGEQRILIRFPPRF